MSQVNWITEPDAYLEPKIGSTGFASKPATTIIEIFKETVLKHGDRNAIATKEKVDGVITTDWKYWTYKQYWDDCVKFAKTLVHLKVERFKVVNILGFNSPEWFISSTGSILAGCISAGIYATNTADACHHISEQSKAEIVIMDGNHQLKKYADFQKSSLPNLKAIVMYTDEPDQELVQKSPFPVYTWAQFIELGAEIPTTDVEKRGNEMRPGHCAVIIYTSGTTGPPKGVMISHDNICWTSQNVQENYLHLSHEERVVSYLPLSHIAGQLTDIYLPIWVGGCAYFAQPDSLKGSGLTKLLKEVHPTFFFGVPRVWEKMHEKMVEIGRNQSWFTQMIATWAKYIGTEHSNMAQYGNTGGKPFLYDIANMLVFSKIKAALGFDQTKVFFTAAAPISIETLQYFASIDIPIYEIFGTSECTGPHTITTTNAWKIATCGRPIKGTESKIAIDTKELCYRGRHVFMGYLYLQDKTSKSFDENGYFLSGDMAEFDEDNDIDITEPSGFMKIIGRIKDLIVTSGGENIPPVLIENEIKNQLLGISNCIVIGDKKKFLTMLISLKVEMNADGIPTDNLAADALYICKQINSNVTTYSDAQKDSKWIEYINNGMKKANEKTTSRAQVVQKWAFLPTDFSEKTGELTPTLKVKRNVVIENNKELIDSLYESKESK